MPVAPPPAGRPTWAEIDLGALLHNFRVLDSLLKSDCGLRIADCELEPVPDAPLVTRHSSLVAPRLIPVLKADAYGHGAVQVARALAGAGASCLAVAIIEEGVELREAGIEQEIMVLEGCWPGQEEAALNHRLVPAVHSPEGIRRLERAARPAERPVRVHIKIDTGMNRLGVPWDRLNPVLDALQESTAVRLAGVFSHLACAEEEDTSFTVEQTARFHQAVSYIRDRGVNPGELHLANSAGLLYHPSLRTMSGRPGIALYGYPPDPRRCPVSLTPPLSLKSRIGRIQTIPAGASVGYNRSFVALRATRIATLPIGYADGYRRSLAGKGQVIVRDRLVPVLGSVNMDMIVIDITDLAEVEGGEDAILLGSSPHYKVDAASLAQCLGTSPYEILCGISARVPRIYLRPDDTVN